MTREENIEAFETAIRDYLEPVFKEHFTLETWADIWAYEKYHVGGKVIKDLQRHLPAVDGLYATIDEFKCPDPWHAVCGFDVVVSLGGHEIPVNFCVNRGEIIHLEVEMYFLEDYPEVALELNLTKEFEKKQTWVALKG